MDGNRRWAKQRLLPSFAWHKAWFENAKNLIELTNEKNIDCLTLWGLSKENLENRSSEELDWLFSLFNKFFDLVPLMLENNIKFQTIWDIQKLPENTQKILQEMKDKTQNNTGMTLVLALVYSWQDEIIRAMKKAFSLWVDFSTLGEKEFRKFLDTAAFPPVDLIIRTGWDVRHSWYLLYDSAYSEYTFTQTLFPDFSKEEFERILEKFLITERKFGK
jgi:undecaprenyl diphosphate synthase